jgi:hypothetical protein
MPRTPDFIPAILSAKTIQQPERQGQRDDPPRRPCPFISEKDQTHGYFAH